MKIYSNYSLFDDDSVATIVEKKKEITIDEAVVYMTALGGYIGDMYIMDIDDAKKFCSLKETCGTSGNRQWAFHFTQHNKNYKKENFLKDD